MFNENEDLIIDWKKGITLAIKEFSLILAGLFFILITATFVLVSIYTVFIVPSYILINLSPILFIVMLFAGTLLILFKRAKVLGKLPISKNNILINARLINDKNNRTR